MAKKKDKDPKPVWEAGIGYSITKFQQDLRAWEKRQKAKKETEKKERQVSKEEKKALGELKKLKKLEVKKKVESKELPSHEKDREEYNRLKALKKDKKKVLSTKQLIRLEYLEKKFGKLKKIVKEFSRK